MDTNSEFKFPIIGIGASAGGLTALKEFFSNLTENIDFPLTFVVVQHLSPDHKSTMDEILRKYTSRKIYQVWENDSGIEIEPDTIYLIPPNRYMTLKGDKLYLDNPKPQQSIRFSIDTFFISLAQSVGERAICVILSGTGSDGVKGIEAIKGENGMVMVQEPETAEHEAMPCGVINTGLVDYILPPQKMPAQLISFVEHTFINNNISQSIESDDPKLFQEIFRALKAKVGHDFSGYKESTIKRCIQRRMAVRQFKSLKEYVGELKNDNAEIKSLFKDILVGVTSFFRDPKVFVSLKETVIPELINGKDPGSALRVWVPACSTGEEAYSIAILIREELKKLNQYHKVYIFATDIDSDSVEKARLGMYPASSIDSVSKERLKNFFTYSYENDYYQVTKEIRELIIFAEQSVIEDPPFTKLDLICCRNFLIFLKPDIQKRALHIFHYALNEGGYLLLGTSETVNELAEFYKNVDGGNKIYKKKDSLNYPRSIPRGISTSGKENVKFTSSTSKKEEKTDLQNLSERVLLRYYTPAGVIINEFGEILYIHGRTGKYLEPSSGKARMNIFQMVREGLKLELSESVRGVNNGLGSYSYQGLKVKNNGEAIRVDLDVFPISQFSSEYKDLIMVVFEETTSRGYIEPYQREETATSNSAVDKDKRIAELEQELRDKEEYLQATIEELGTYNEELQSVNEEFQSTNEELETSKEELQSLNEELTSVNRELLEKIEELRNANNDMNNMLVGTAVGIIFLDESNCIKSFTPPIMKIFNLMEGDEGRPLGHITTNLIGYDAPELEDNIKYVLNTHDKVEKEVQAKDYSWFLMRVLPYKTTEDKIEGVVINFVDITELKRVQAKENRLAVVIQDANDAILVIDLEGKILAWNKMAEKFYGWTESEALKMNISEVIPNEEVEESIENLNKVASQEEIKPYQTQRISKEGAILKVQLTATVLLDHYGEPYAIATTERVLLID